eukprot:Skav208961  [mRNA]  locus=scaffold1580:356303:368706:- [translate_table: standard]
MGGFIPLATGEVDLQSDAQERSKKMSFGTLEEESTACRSEIFDESGSEDDDMDAEVTEERRRILRERANQQRVGRTRRTQKLRVVRRCTETTSKPCKDPRCENCNRKLTAATET